MLSKIYLSILLPINMLKKNFHLIPNNLKNYLQNFYAIILLYNEFLNSVEKQMYDKIHKFTEYSPKTYFNY